MAASTCDASVSAPTIPAIANKVSPISSSVLSTPVSLADAAAISKFYIIHPTTTYLVMLLSFSASGLLLEIMRQRGQLRGDSFQFILDSIPGFSELFFHQLFDLIMRFRDSFA